MCGRYTLHRLDHFLQAFFRNLEAQLRQHQFTPREKILPSEECPIIHRDSAGAPVLAFAKWGFIPHWMKSKPKTRPINAKSETAATNGMFRQAMRRQRCLVPLDGFHESGHLIRLKDDRPFALAGIWDQWKADEATAATETFAILTTQPNDIIRPIHDRMPVILDEAEYERWMDPNNDAKAVANLLNPFNADRIVMEKIAATPARRKDNDPWLFDPA